MCKMLYLPSGATTLGGDRRQIINSDIHNPQLHLKEDLCDSSLVVDRGKGEGDIWGGRKLNV